MSLLRGTGVIIDRAKRVAYVPEELFQEFVRAFPGQLVGLDFRVVIVRKPVPPPSRLRLIWRRLFR